MSRGWIAGGRGVECRLGQGRATRAGAGEGQVSAVRGGGGQGHPEVVGGQLVGDAVSPLHDLGVVVVRRSRQNEQSQAPPPETETKDAKLEARLDDELRNLD